MADDTTYQPISSVETGDQDRPLPPALTTAAQPIVDKAKALFKARPFAMTALAAVLGIATLNTLRGKR